MSHKDKLDAAITVKLSGSQEHFVRVRANQMGMESPGEYLRDLIARDEAMARHDISLLADAIGVKVNLGNLGNLEES